MSVNVKIPQINVQTENITNLLDPIRNNLKATQQEEETQAIAPELSEEQIAEKELKFDNIITATKELVAEIEKDIATKQAELDSVENPSEENYAYRASLSGEIANLRKEQTNYRLLIDNAQREVVKKDKDGNPIINENGEEEKESLFTLERAEKYLVLAGLGILVAEDVNRLLGGDDIDPIDIDAELDKATEAVTDPARMDKIITASYRDNPRLGDLENLSTYRNQFGAMSSEFFNSDFGTELESAYQELLKDNPNLNRDQFLVEFARANPTNPISQEINFRLSRMGQLERSTNTIAQIDRALIRDGLADASKFYKSADQGGYGFTPNDFRTNDQQKLVQRAMGLTDGMDMLQESIGRRIRNQGRMGSDEVRDITARALTSVDPSLSGQAYLRNGGMGRAVLNNSNARMNRLVQAENSMGNLLGLKQGALATANNVVNTNTMDPVKAFGMTGSNTSLANQIYSTNPTTGQNYDPTGQYFSSITGMNNNINQANSMNSNGSTLINMSDNLGRLRETLQD